MMKVWSSSMMLIVFVLSILSWSVSPSSAQSDVVPQAEPTAPETVIAFITPSRDNREIRLLNPDGSNQRSVFTIPDGLNRVDGIGTLSWKPDGTEIAFDSGHEWKRSMWIRDIYAITPDGSRLRRLTNAPQPTTLTSFPQGGVTVRVRNPSGVGTELLVYIDGSSDISQFTAVGSGVYSITFPRVADYGPNTRQFVRMINLAPRPNLSGNNCYYDLAVFADVIAGQTIDIGPLNGFIGNSFTCVAPFSPSWDANGAHVGYIAVPLTTGIGEVHNLYQVPNNPPLQSGGAMVLNMNQYVSSDQLFLLAMGPPAQADQMLFVQNGATNNFIYRAPINDAEQNRLVDLGLCPRTSCDILGIAWIPDGSGFFFSRYESGSSLGNPPPAGGAIYRYTFANSRFTEIFRTPGQAIGRISVAPDGATLAFERAASLDGAIDTVRTGPRLLCPCSIWLIGANGADPRQLVADGRAPAWSQRAPQFPAPLTPRLWFPLAT
jgi:hypothetical protein